MPDGPKADIKLGFWIGAGLTLFALVLIIARMLLARARGTAGG